MLKAIAEVAKVILVKRDIVIEETMKNTDLFGDIVVLRIHDLLIGFENATLRFLTTEELSDNSNRKQGCHYLIVIQGGKTYYLRVSRPFNRVKSSFEPHNDIKHAL